jgi:hypoxanthine-guanine phosphoribosyltransferase
MKMTIVICLMAGAIVFLVMLIVYILLGIF